MCMADVSKLLLLLLLLPLLMASSAASKAPPGCPSNCGEVEIPYPFGFGEDCARDKSFLISCNNTVDPPKPFFRDMEVLKINLSSGEVTVNHDISRGCYKYTSEMRRDNIRPIDLRVSPFALSTRNKFTATGCATAAFMTNHTANNSDYTSACTLLCPYLRLKLNNTCAGVGCCENSFPEGLKYFGVEFDTYYGKLNNSDEYPCSYAFLVEEGEFHFNTSFLSIENLKMKLPVVLDWAVEKCSTNSFEKPSAGGLEGNLCECLPGFEGNPYDLNDSCEDIDECEGNDAKCFGKCINTPGSYECKCPEGTSGNATKINGCVSSSTTKSKIIIGLAGGLGGGMVFLLLIGGSILIYKRSKKIMKKKLKQKYYHQNHGLLLEQLLSSHGETTERTKIFTLKELEKATNNFNKARIIGDGGHGTVYKGLLLDQRVVAIKKSKEMNETEIKEFINEISLLSRIDHRNVVKLHGCCLESEVPLLVYEFISNGTLSHHLDTWIRDSFLSWSDRVRIATEVAAAIAYLHFASSKSIIHRDLKSANILLDERLTAKVSDFGASKAVMSEQTHITTAVQGTFGYLDPEYYHTGRLTDKSDVYALGVILVELLTGEKPVSKTRSREEGNLTTRFLSALKENQLLQISEAAIVNEAEREELEVFARLAEACLRWWGEERPTMKEVEITLEGLRKSKKKQKVQMHHKETERLLAYQTSDVSSSGSTTRKLNSQGPFISSQTFQR